jgi:hypothetical protein
VSFQRMKTWKISRDPDYAAKKARVEHLYASADGEVIPEEGEPDVVLCLDEFGPLNLQRPSWAAVDRARRQAQGPRPGTEAPAAGDLHPPARGPAPASGGNDGRRRQSASHGP